MIDALVRMVRVVHMTIGISEPSPAEERTIAMAWLGVVVALVAVFLVGLFVLG